MSNNSNTKSGGIGFLGLLGLIFITLKLCSVINWSWWWVLAPIYAIPAIGFGIAAVCAVLWIITAIGYAIVKTTKK